MTFIYCSQILLFHYHHLHKIGIFHIKSAEIFHLLTLSPEGNFIISENQHLDVSQRLLILDQLIVESAESTDYMNSM